MSAQKEEALRVSEAYGRIEFMPHFARVVDVIKARGAKVTTQLHHAGAMACVAQPMGPSRLSTREFFVTKPEEFSTEEVEQLVDKFADAAVRAKACGVDMVEIHGAHGYLVCQFISPPTNHKHYRKLIPILDWFRK